jgi:hypothetical protein
VEGEEKDEEEEEEEEDDDVRFTRPVRWTGFL